MNPSRKTFLKNTLSAAGGFLTVAGLQSCSGGEPRLAGKAGGSAGDPILQAEANGLKTPILKALNCGITAPNPHNTQAWKFKIENDSTADLYVDENRILPHTDPPGRQVHIGQGTFIEHFRLGAEHMGYTVTIGLFPEGTYDIQDIGTKPVARLELIKAAGNPAGTAAQQSSHNAKLYAQIPKRLTNRTVYDEPAPNKDDFAAVTALAGAGHSTIRFMDGTDRAQMQKLRNIFYQAMEIECNTFLTYEESREWFRYNDEEIYTKRDGISLRGSGMGGFMRFMVGMIMDRSKEDWHDKSNINTYLSAFQEKVNSSGAYAFFITRDNTPADWVKTGQDYARFQLALTARNLVMHPLSQVLQEYKEMTALQKEFNHLLKPDGRVQMLVRIGRSDYGFKAPRRPVKDMLI